MDPMRDVVWQPSEDIIARANLTRLMRKAGIASYDELVQRSQDEPEWFWPAAVDDLGLDFFEPWEAVYDDSRGIEWTTWFVGAKLNVAWNCVHRHARGPRADAEAMVFAGEDGRRRSLTFAELSEAVTRLAEGLASLGIGEGDAVALYLPMSPQAAIASHACAHLGAIQVPIFSGFAAHAVAARLIDSEARVVITADASLRRGKRIAMKDTIDEALTDSPSVERVVVWKRLGDGEVSMVEPRDIDWDHLVREAPGLLEPKSVDAETPYLLAYTSGTTGVPKGAVHVQGGFLASITREVGYQVDARPEDTILFATDMGWVMGPWTLVGGGALGCRLVLMEGAPDLPSDRLWTLIEREQVSILGISPTLARSLMAHGTPRADLSSLRMFVTTGEPWNTEPYRWLADEVGDGRSPIMNLSGGTEVGACFLTCSVLKPIKTCSFTGPALGMAMDVVDDEGSPIRGEVGELVCRKPFPGMTRGIWRDPERYLDAYWRRLPGVWVHGDWASIDEDGYWFLHGRSDDTLNVAGKRIGPAEIESAVVSHGAVIEAAAVGIPDEIKGEVAWAFCVLRDDIVPTAELGEEIAGTAAAELGKAFTPSRIVFVPGLPKTRTAKVVRRAVRASALGTDPGDLSSLENPETLEAIADATRTSAAAESSKQVEE